MFYRKKKDNTPQATTPVQKLLTYGLVLFMAYVLFKESKDEVKLVIPPSTVAVKNLTSGTEQKIKVNGNILELKIPASEKETTLQINVSNLIEASKAKAESSKPRFRPERESDLPNLIETESVRVKNKFFVTINLNEGWQIDEKVSTNLRLFKDKEFVEQFNRDDVKKGIQLKLEDGEYLLQGSIYYHVQGSDSASLVASINQIINVDSQSKLDEIKLSF